MGKDEFAGYHPIVNFAYFCTVIACGVLLLHPVFIAIAFGGALCYALYLRGKKLRKTLGAFLFPIMMSTVIINALVNHRGTTFLFYVGRNPITLESVIYGAITAFMLATIILWFTCYTDVMTGDKFMYLFGRAAPASTLIFSMVLRFVPGFTAQAKIISDGQKSIGRDVSNGTFKQKIGHGMQIMSIMTTWTMENAIDTADSMKSRGYGAPGRTGYSLFHWDRRDGMATASLAIIAIGIIFGAVNGRNTLTYYPTLDFHNTDVTNWVLYILYFAICFAPVLINIGEQYKWKRLQSKI